MRLTDGQDSENRLIDLATQSGELVVKDQKSAALTLGDIAKLRSSEAGVHENRACPDPRDRSHRNDKLGVVATQQTDRVTSCKSATTKCRGNSPTAVV